VIELMKVERKRTEPVFEPVVITLETQEEAETVFHLTNAGFIDRYFSNDRYRSPANFYSIKGNLWEALDKLFSPRRTN